LLTSLIHSSLTWAAYNLHAEASLSIFFLFFLFCVQWFFMATDSKAMDKRLEHGAKASQLPSNGIGSRFSNLEKSFKYSIRSLLTSCSKEVHFVSSFFSLFSALLLIVWYNERVNNRYVKKFHLLTLNGVSNNSNNNLFSYWFKTWDQFYGSDWPDTRPVHWL